MLFHVSLPAHDPAHVAAVFAEIWGGRAYAFPPFPGSYIAFADDDRGTALEIYPKGQVMIPDDSEVGEREMAVPSHTETHVAMASPLSEDRIHAIAHREGWQSRSCVRGGGMFGVVEVWVENVLMVEVLTADMQAEYLASVSADNWERRFGLKPLASATQA